MSEVETVRGYIGPVKDEVDFICVAVQFFRAPPSNPR